MSSTRLAKAEIRTTYSVDSLNSLFYDHIYVGQRHPSWKGVEVCKMPTDMILYAMVIQECKPKWIIESGTYLGGSSLFFQDVLDTLGKGGKVITIDVELQVKKRDLRIVYITDTSTSLEAIKTVKGLIRKDPTMVVLDSYHLAEHVKWELSAYSKLVTKGQYLVVEDCYNRGGIPGGPKVAVDWFMENNKEFEQTDLDSRFILGSCRGGWLKRK